MVSGVNVLLVNYFVWDVTSTRIEVKDSKVPQNISSFSTRGPFVSGVALERFGAFRGRCTGTKTALFLSLSRNGKTEQNDS